MNRDVLRIAVGMILLGSTLALATVQVDDALDLNGETGLIDENPLRPYLDFRGIRFVMRSTANYAGYTCRWKIADGKLYLTDLAAKTESGLVGLEYLFPDQKPPVLADWFTGTLYWRTGDVKLRALSGHIKVTTNLTVLRILNGVLKRSESYSYPENIHVINEQFGHLLEREIDVERMVAEENKRLSKSGSSADTFGSLFGGFPEDSTPGSLLEDLDWNSEQVSGAHPLDAESTD